MQEINDHLHGDAKRLWIGGYSQGAMMSAVVAFNLKPTIGGIVQMVLGCEPGVVIEEIGEEKKQIKIHFIVAQ